MKLTVVIPDDLGQWLMAYIAKRALAEKSSFNRTDCVREQLARLQREELAKEKKTK